MRRTLPDDGDATFDRILLGATSSLWRFEQQHFYRIDDEGGLLADFGRGVLTPPDQAPGLRAWFDQVRAWTRAGVRVSRLRILDSPPTQYQRWLQYVDRWNRDAGEEILYLSRRAADRVPGQPFGADDWWLVDRKLALIMCRDADGNRTKVELSDDPAQIVQAVRFAQRAERAALERTRPARAA